MNFSEPKNETLPGELSVVATWCERHRFSVDRPRSGGGTKRNEKISHGATAGKLY
jgi:hypothetical protein